MSTTAQTERGATSTSSSRRELPAASASTVMTRCAYVTEYSSGSWAMPKNMTRPRGVTLLATTDRFSNET